MDKIENDTVLISAFPGTGKTYLYNNTDRNVLDSDSSNFNKDNFPSNYIKHIKSNIGKVDAIFISSHKKVREALVKNGLSYLLVYPKKQLKEEYLNRYKNRGSSDAFISFIDDNWDSFIDGLRAQNGCKHIRLGSEEYITDKFQNLL